MARPSTAVARIRAALEPYLDAAERAWLEQPSGRRTPTLPHTAAPERKLNVTELCRRAGLGDGDTQYFHKPRYRELRDLVNVFARAQGLRPIGARAPEQEEGADEEVTEAVVRRLGREKERQTERHAQARARIAQLERELAEERDRRATLERRLAHAQRTGMLVRDRGVA